MKIAICGKGGSGKSTVASLLAKAYAKKGNRVLVIDCDESNYGLHQQLGMKLPKSFIDNFGGKNEVMKMLEVGPMNMPMLFDKQWTFDDIPSDYISEKDGVLLMSPGKIETANEACACSFNALMCQFVPVLKLRDNEAVIMDMEAGIEHFGRGTDNAVEAILMVVDPSYESIKLSCKIEEIATKINKPIYYVINKTPDDMIQTVKEGIKSSDKICGVINDELSIKSAGLKGEELSVNNDTINSIIDKLF
ncbi:MAG: AAA family ATPase [Lachnospiraceae bacterium]|nr:AAA family ATPase [Lachnospiraceae bacterium]